MTGTYHSALVVFSVLIAIFASYTALALAARVTAAEGRFRAAWLAGGSVALGIGIWSMHFVGMLAFHLPVPISYDVPLWLASMGVAVAASLLALWVASRPRVGPGALAAAGVLMGAAIAGMHYVGMAAMRIPGRIGYRPGLVAASVAVAVVASILALWLAMRWRTDDSPHGRWMKGAAAVVMGFAVAGMHYTAMAAAVFTPGGGRAGVPQDHVLRTEGLAAGVIVGTVVLLTLTVAGAMVDRRMRARSAETEAVRRSEARFRSLVAASARVVFTTDDGGHVVEPQPELSAYSGVPFDRYGGLGWLECIHPDDRPRTEQVLREAMETSRVVELEYRLCRADGQWRRMAVRAVPVFAPGSGVREWVFAAADVTERRAAERGRELLADSSRLLASSLDYETTLRTVARLAVPALADWCAVDVLTVDGEVQRIAVEHTDAEKIRLVSQIQERWPTRRDAPHGLYHVLRTGEPEFVPDIPTDMLRAAAQDPEHLEALLALGLRSYLCIPLVARGRTLGALTVVYAESGRRYGAAELQVAEELARRAAVAIDNARLFGEMEDARNALEQQTAELEETQAEMEMAHDELQHAYEDLAARTMEAERARAAADEANAAKSSFLATMSHELRTPLNAIAGYAQLMEMGIHGEVTKAQGEALAKIRRNQVHLLGLINDVLNFAKLEAGQVQYQLRELPLDEVLAAVEPLVEPQIRARGLAYVYRPGDPAVTVCADRERMEQVVLNLLTNAIKFTEPGGRVEMGWEADARTVSVHVRDTGRGIPADKLDAIFEPFVQVDPALTRAAEGTGLGLAISRDLARAMNGDLRVTSREDEGSVFTLVLPRGSA
jgi:PAS domain S-box-containing protein